MIIENTPKQVRSPKRIPTRSVVITNNMRISMRNQQISETIELSRQAQLANNK